MTACETGDARLRLAATRTGETEASRNLPNYPDDCRKRERSGVREGEPLDTALIRTDNALDRANARVRRCARWYDGIRTGFERGAN
ncbi:hypothetical protein [Roseibium aggregatum]|uniref:Uncharacterized protein n=1 Tax=Roseibium aggregatum TaxID=187304 RepID=A0A939EEC2_9HYPH|nr:hypothetical protein [Roseibium aggregatum]MBN9671686.1 hypothetical protein [Roseibium aggregatum]